MCIYRKGKYGLEKKSDRPSNHLDFTEDKGTSLWYNGYVSVLLLQWVLLSFLKQQGQKQGCGEDVITQQVWEGSNQKTSEVILENAQIGEKVMWSDDSRFIRFQSDAGYEQRQVKW